ncbi:MAG: hypothetical protein AVDCRST_MAG25-3468 [uncultured Rubrobacteraceae bacterium]|uniref:Uncharacterized protein n=1 Tax=uncultured Rubrobacteraceae bacterium TaxID=349277 RepID=A0A6J4SA89_9ACTN|nr:MAG: hypothetical protein AVDCRST_MAG25-3468 [uncultured Rubrobacteraceae bacterium]
MFRDFVYLDINRVQSILAQLQQGLLNEVMEGKMEQTSGKMQMAVNLLAMLLPVSASGSVEHSRGTSFSESKVLHDYAFEAARRSLEDERLLLEDDGLDRDDVPETGFVLVRGSARISDYRTLEKISANFDKVDKIFSTRTGKQPGMGKTMKEMTTVIDSFFKDSIRVKITNPQGCEFIGPLAREHLREDIRDLIYKYSSAPEGEWVMLADIARVPDPEDSEEEALMERLEAVDGGSVSSQMGKAMGMLNVFQELFGSVAYPEVAVSPIAVYREIDFKPGT